MAQFVILGMKDDTKVWLVDLESKTVDAVDQATAQAMGAVGSGLKGVDFAVAANARSDASSQALWKS